MSEPVETPLDHVTAAQVGAALVLRGLATAAWCAAVPLVVATAVVGFEATPHALVEIAAISVVLFAAALELQVRRLGAQVTRAGRATRSRRATT